MKDVTAKDPESMYNCIKCRATATEVAVKVEY